MKNSKQKIWLKITCFNVIVLSITQNYPSALWFSKHYWVLSYLEIIGWMQSLQFRNEPTFWRQNNCSRIHCSSWDVVTHQHSGDPAILFLVSALTAQAVVTHQHSGDPAMIFTTGICTGFCRNSPTFWWPCNCFRWRVRAGHDVVTHQHSGAPAIQVHCPFERWVAVVTHQHSGDLAIVPHLKPL